MGYSDSDWAGDPSSRKSLSSGHVEADSCRLTSFLEGKDVATSSGMAEYNAMCSSSEELLDLRTILQHFVFSVNITLFLRLSGCAEYSAESWTGDVKAL